MFISKKELKQIQLNFKNINDGLYGAEGKYQSSIGYYIIDLAKIINMIMGYLNLEIVEEPQKKYIRKKIKEVQKKQ